MVCATFIQAQTNLLVNPSFETWVDNKPLGWDVPSNPAHSSAITIVDEITITKDGTHAMKLTIDNSQNPGFAQLVPITPGLTYTVSVNYYVVAGDGTDARIWCSFKKW